ASGCGPLRAPDLARIRRAHVRTRSSDTPCCGPGVPGAGWTLLSGIILPPPRAGKAAGVSGRLHADEADLCGRACRSWAGACRRCGCPASARADGRAFADSVHGTAAAQRVPIEAPTTRCERGVRTGVGATLAWRACSG